MKIRIGSRGSNLALWQAHWVSEAVAKLGAQSEIVIIKTTGDARMDRFSAIDTKGIFIKEIEEALLAREIDLAVHSLKDLPTILPAKLTLAAIPVREDPADVLIATASVSSLATLGAGARVGTSSPRRVSQLRALRPDLRPQEIRGNVETRIRKVDGGEVDAVILAYAGVHRLGLDNRINAKLGLDTMLPAPGQGALALEIHEENSELAKLLESLNHPPTRSAVEAERLLLEGLGGGCRLPLGAYASWRENRLALKAVIGNPDTSQILRVEAVGASPREVSENAAQSLLSQGVLEWLRHE